MGSLIPATTGADTWSWNSSDPRKIAQNWNSELRKLIGWAKPRQHHQLRRGKRARRQHHTRAGICLEFRAFYFVFDATCSLIPHDDPGDGGIGLERERAVSFDPTEIGARRAAATSAGHRCLIVADANLTRPVEVMIEGQPEFLPSAHKRGTKPVMRRDITDGQRSRGAMEGLGKRRIAFGVLEPREDIGPGPAVVSQRVPAIIVVSLAADVDHGVDRAGPSENATLWNWNSAIRSLRLRLGFVSPAISTRRQLGVASWDPNERMPIIRPRFEQQHTRAALDQAGRDHTTGRAGADHDKIIGLCFHHRFLFAGNRGVLRHIEPARHLRREKLTEFFWR